MIVEPLASRMAKNLNLSVDFAIGEGLNGALGLTEGMKDKNLTTDFTDAHR